MNFIVQLDNAKFKQKPKGREPAIRDRLSRTPESNVSLSEFSNAVISGRTFSPGILSGGGKAENWIKQQIFCIDVDNEDKKAPEGEKRQAENPLSIGDALQKCQNNGIEPALIYETFSSTEYWLKFRIVFVSPQIITDPYKRDYIQKALMDIFPECDAKCGDRARIFFGGKKILHYNENVVLSENSIAYLIEQRKAEEALTALESQRKRDPSLEALLSGFDFYGYLQNRFSFEKVDYGSYCHLNPCPICGHNNDFQFDKVHKTWHCHSSSTSGNNGGTIIDFLIWKDGMTDKEAVAHFKYTLCGVDPGEDLQSYLEMQMLSNARKNGFVLDGDGLPDYFVFNSKQKRFSISTPLLAEYIRLHENILNIHDPNARENKIFLYDDGVYSPANDSTLQGNVKHYVTDFDRDLLKMSQVREVVADLKSDLNFIERSELDADESIINFRNGLYSLKDGTLSEHDPSVYSTIQLPCDYDPEAKQHGTFDKYIWGLSNGNTEIIELLCEFMGIAVTNVDGSRFKKAVIMYGKGDTGKSQLLRLTQKLLGANNYSSGSLSDLEERFGTSSLFGKRLYGDADMSFVSVPELKAFKQATGGDNIKAEYKGESAFSFQYRGLLWFCTNALPTFSGDRGKWVYDRIIPIECVNVIPADRQDARLLDKMYAERDAIISDVLIPAATRAINRGYRFSVPSMCGDVLESYKIDNSPVATFYTECCEMRAADDPCNDNFTCSSIYENFKFWYSNNYSGRTSMSKQKFRKELSAYFDKSIDELTIKKAKTNYYTFKIKG